MKLEFTTLKSPPKDISRLNTIVFIDYESLYVGFSRQYSLPPLLEEIVEEIKSNGKIIKINVFGDFTKPNISQERNRIRTVTSNIIDCGNESAILKKDFTDFILLDHIYQELIQNPSVEQFILFTGDGHFSSVATFMRNYMDKTVGVYGVCGSLSRQLRDCSSWCKELCALEFEDTDIIDHQRNLLDNLKSAVEKGLRPTFRKTVDITHKISGGDRFRYERVLSKLIEDGYIRQEKQRSKENREFTMLIVDWDKVHKELWHLEDEAAEQSL